MGFLDQLQIDTNKSVLTENGAITNASTLDPVLDFFSLAGAKRGREDEAFQLFEKAFIANPQLAIRCLFYLRDVRGGQGERSVFRYIFNHLSENVKASVAEHVEQYGRWDDVEIESYNFPMIKAQLDQDVENLAAGKSISLLAKWLPSTNASSSESRRQALKLAAALGLKESQYRKLLVKLRTKIDLLETKMSSREWGSIDYEKLPTQAHRKHVKAFIRHDEARYKKYLDDVEKGEKKINSNVAYTYEIYDLLFPNGQSYYGNVQNDSVIRAADAMWKALPDYTSGKNALVLADVSGSMTGRPMSVSVSLALYFAERNTGTFKDYYVTFSDQPVVQKVVGSTINDKFRFIERTHVGYNTDLQRAFRAILQAAVNDKTAKEDMPEILYIISDMEFDDQISGNNETNFQTAQREFAEAGYELPHVVFWNVNARQNQAPATKFDDKVTLISGASQSTFQYAVAGKNPVELMLEVLNSPRYDKIIYKS